MAHRRHHDGASGGVNLSLVITPMLDMSFQLLAFFIMTYHPSAMEAHIDGKLLPAAKAVFAGPAMGEKKDDTPPSDQEPDVKQTVRVVVKAVPAGQREGVYTEGQPSKIMLKIPDVAEPEELTNPSMTLKAGLDKLKARLKELRNSPTGGKLSVTIDADPNLRYGYFIAVQDTCKAAKFDNIGFAAPLPAGQ